VVVLRCVAAAMTGRALKPDDGVRLERIGNVVCVICRCRDDYQAMEIFDLLSVWSRKLSLPVELTKETDGLTK
jgi:hypothetical protein